MSLLSSSRARSAFLIRLLPIQVIVSTSSSLEGSKQRSYHKQKAYHQRKGLLSSPPVRSPFIIELLVIEGRQSRGISTGSSLEASKRHKN